MDKNVVGKKKFAAGDMGRHRENPLPSAPRPQLRRWGVQPRGVSVPLLVYIGRHSDIVRVYEHCALA